VRVGAKGLASPAIIVVGKVAALGVATLSTPDISARILAA